MPSLSYKPPGAVLKAFMKSDRFVRGIQGPIGSGKSSVCCVEIVRRALAQRPSPVDKVRYSRWAIVRNTYQELRTTTAKTWLNWFPETEIDPETGQTRTAWGKFRWDAPFTHHLKLGDLDCEVLFLALDRPEDIRKLLSLELTGAWLNEARELPKEVVDGATQRVGRYPPKKHGGPSWYGVILDSNAPDELHWWSILSGQVAAPSYLTEEDRLSLLKPDGWEFFLQPGAMQEVIGADRQLVGYAPNPAAENVTNLEPDYYTKQMAGKSRAYIRSYICNILQTLQSGKAVYPTFRRETHIAKEPLVPWEGREILIGIDFGRTPAAVFGQTYGGRWRILRELVTWDTSARTFATLLRQEMALYPGHRFRLIGDPAGDQMGQTEDETPFRILRAAGLSAFPAPSNDPVLRIEAVTHALDRMVDGRPAVQIDPGCTTLIAGFEGGYHYRRLNVSGAARYEDSPSKNDYSHVHDGAQYLMLGGGEGRALLAQAEAKRPVQAPRQFDVFARQGRKAATRTAFRRF